MTGPISIESFPVGSPKRNVGGSLRIEPIFGKSQIEDELSGVGRRIESFINETKDYSPEKFLGKLLTFEPDILTINLLDHSVESSVFCRPNLNQSEDDFVTVWDGEYGELARTDSAMNVDMLKHVVSRVMKIPSSIQSSERNIFQIAFPVFSRATILPDKVIMLYLTDLQFNELTEIIKKPVVEIALNKTLEGIVFED